jgi:hypothetical protein
LAHVRKIFLFVRNDNLSFAAFAIVILCAFIAGVSEYRAAPTAAAPVALVWPKIVPLSVANSMGQALSQTLFWR